MHCFDFQDVLQTARLSYHKPMVEYLDVAIRKVFPAENKSRIRIIDAGAGTGLVGEALAKLGYTNMDALDISQEMLDEAEKKKVYTKFICAPLNETAKSRHRNRCISRTYLCWITVCCTYRSGSS